MSSVTFTDLSNNLATHLDNVEQDRTELVVTRESHEPVVIVSLSDWQGMKETLHLLSTPENARRLRASIADANADRLVARDLIEP